MQTNNPFFDDLARVAGGAMGALSGLRGEFEALVRQQMERLMAGMDVVPRDEFEAVRAMAVKAREQQDALAARVAELEARLAATTPKTATEPPKPAPKSPAPKPRAARPKPAKKTA